MVTKAIYTIAKNEEHHVDAFMDSCEGADLVLIGDTGSTDRTIEKLRARNAQVVSLHVTPWRFDIARNCVLSLLPPDMEFCMPLDLDERLPKGWAEQIDAHWRHPTHTRLRFRYVHSFNSDGSPAHVGMKDFGHSRKDYIWRHAVHESLYYVGDATENVCHIPGLVVEHRQSPKTSRDSYLELLESECDSPTVTPRHMFWLVREYFNREMWVKTLEWGEKLLGSDAMWEVERAHTYRYMAKAYSHCNEPSKALTAHWRSIDTAPHEREVWVDLAWYHHARTQWAQTYGAIMQAFTITHRPEHYLTTQEAWGSKIHELAALCAFKLGMMEASVAHIQRATSINPSQKDAILQGARRLGIKV